jgi:hypothetical protein
VHGGGLLTRHRDVLAGAGLLGGVALDRLGLRLAAVRGAAAVGWAAGFHRRLSQSETLAMTSLASMNAHAPAPMPKMKAMTQQWKASS